MTTTPLPRTAALETESKQSTNDTSASETLDDADRPGSEEKSPTVDQENDPPQPSADEGNESKQSSFEAASSSSSSDVVLVPSEESEGHMESLDTKDQPSVSGAVLDPVTGEITP